MKKIKKVFKKSLLYWLLLGIVFIFSLEVPRAETYQIVVANDYERVTNTSNLHNCVFFTRKLVPNLPYGLTTFQNKKNIINSQMAEKGAVAIVQTENIYGHVSYVEKVQGSLITTIDANWKYQGRIHIVRRTGTKEQLHIVGFYIPKRNNKVKQKKIYSIPKRTGSFSLNNKIPKKSSCSIKYLTKRISKTKSGIAVYAFVKKNVKDKVTETGFYLWETDKEKPIKPYVKNHYKTDFTKQNTITIYYKPGIEFGKKLKSHTKYSYQIYVIINGKTYYTPIATIKTK